MVLHVRFESWYISYPSFAKQQREMTKFSVFFFFGGEGGGGGGGREPQSNFSYLLLELNNVIA